MLQPSPSLARPPRPLPAARLIEPGPLSAEREFVWSDADFERIKRLIYQKAGISLHDGKHAMVYSRVSRRLRETGHTSFSSYLDWLEKHDGSEWQSFINVLTNLVTQSRQFNRILQVCIDVEVQFARRPRLVGILNKGVELWANAILRWQQLRRSFVEQLLESSLFWKRLANGLSSLSEVQRGYGFNCVND